MPGPRGKDSFKQNDLKTARGELARHNTARPDQLRIPEAVRRVFQAKVATDLTNFPEVAGRRDKYRDWLTKRFASSGLRFQARPDITANVKFDVFHGSERRGTVSMPTYAASFKGGVNTGYMHAMTRLTLGQGGGLSRPIDIINRVLKPGMSVDEMNQAITSVVSSNRWTGSKRGQLLTPAAGLNRYRVQVDPSHVFSTNKTYSDRNLTNAQMRTMMGEVHTGAAKLGLKLFADPTKEQAYSKGQLSMFRPSDLHWAGGLFKGGLKQAQVHDVLPVAVTPGLRAFAQARAQRLAGRSSAAGLILHGPLVETGLMHDIRKFNVATGELGRAKSVPGLNVTHRLLFGQAAADIFSDPDQAIHSIELMKALSMGTEIPKAGTHMGFGIGTSYHGFISKTNIAAVRAARDMGAAVIRPMGRADPSHLMEATFGMYVQGMIERGDSRAKILGTIKQAFGAGNFREGGRAVLKGFEQGNFDASGVGRLFDNIEAKDQFQAMRNLTQSLSTSSGLGLADLERMGVLKRDAQGQIQEMRAFGMVGQRSHDAFKFKDSLGRGLNPKSGLRVTSDLIFTARMGGAGLLADYLEDARRQPLIGKHASFRREALAGLGHLFGVGTKAQVSGGVSFNQLLEGRNREFSAFARRVETKVREQGYEKAGVHRMFEGFIRTHRLQHLGQLVGQNAGLTVNLDRSIAVVGSGFKGNISQINLANMTIGGGDEYAYSIMRLLQKGPDSDRLSRMVEKQYTLFAGGHNTPYDKIFRAKLGNTAWHRIQNPIGVAGMSPTDSFDAIVRNNLQQRGHKFSTYDNYGIISEKRFKQMVKADASVDKIYKEFGYIPTLAHRFPQTGRSLVAQRLVVGSNKWFKGKSGVITRAGATKYISGDTDADMQANVLISNRDPRLLAAFRQLEEAQRLPLAEQEVLAQKMITAQFGEAGVNNTRMLDAMHGRGDVPDLMKKAGFEAQVQGALDAQSTKTLTPLIDPLVKLKAISAVVAQKTGLVNYTNSEMRLLQDIVPAMIESAISKHRGTDNVGILRSLNDSIHASAGDIKAGKIPQHLRDAYKDLIAGALPGFHKEKIAGTLAAELSQGALGDVGMEAYEAIHAGQFDSKMAARMLSGKEGTTLIDKLIQSDLMGLEAQQTLSKYVGPSQKVFTEAERLARLATPFGNLPEGDDFLKAMADFKTLSMHMGTQAQVGSVVPGVEAAVKTAEAAAEAAAKKEAPESIADWVSGLYKKYPKAAKAAVGITAGLAALGIAKSAMSSTMTHNADQQDPMRRAPTTQYVMNPMDELGVSLSMSGTMTPEAMQFSSQMINQMAPKTDIRIMDSRVHTSDRVLGYTAEDRLKSIYSRDPLNA